nr:response regulator [Lachnospiraceae bacterium]
EALANAGRGVASVDEVPYSDAWGEFYSAYSPVYDSSGNIAGIIAVDFTADWFEGQLSEQMRSTVMSYIVILLISLLVAAGLSMSIVRPFIKMQGQLLEEKVRAESANHAKSDFLANMSHEIRTPINTMLGMNEMILRESRGAGSLKDIVIYASDVENAGRNLLAIINDILDFSKIEEDRMDLAETPYMLSSMLNDISNTIMFKARDKGLELFVKADSSLPDKLLGDEVRIRQVLTNLLTNAIKYTEKGSVELSIEGTREEDKTLLLKAAVKDTGIGIKKEDLEKLFTRFERLEMERNSTVEGTGLGLVITKRLLDMMGGSITVESEYGKGSMFTVTIPQKIVADEAMGDFQARFEANVLNAENYSESLRAPQARILIVDDTKPNLIVATSLLKETKMKIDTALSGAAAIDLAAKNRYDVILMDQRMPEMDGTETLKRIRATEGGASSDSPVICFTADAVVGARERYISEGFSDYMTKPFNSYALERMIMKYLPEDKVEWVREDDMAPLSKAGIDTAVGKGYCGDDKELYRSILVEFASGKAAKLESIKKSLEDKDWNEYSIQVHAIKSSSKMIGAGRLSEKAAALEAAANSGDGDTVLRDHEAMMKSYEETVRAIISVIPSAAEKKDTGTVMEFAPVSGK